MLDCNICGKELDEWDIQQDFHFERKIQYGSKYDGDVIEIHMCCECFDEVIDTALSACHKNPIKEEF